MILQTLIHRSTSRHLFSRLRAFLSQSQLNWLWAALYLVVVSGGLFLLRSDWSYDDPYITYRYAENLIKGLGFVFNPGERVLATTTPLFTFLLAMLSLSGQSISSLANLVGAFSIALGALLIFDLAHQLKTPLVGWTGLLLYPTCMLLPDTIGSETPLYLAFCLGCFALYARQSYKLTQVAAALAVLTRPDGILVPLILVVDYILRFHRVPPWKAIAPFLILILPWFIFAWLYFGSPLPSTLLTKQHHGLMQANVPFEAGLLDRVIYYTTIWRYQIQFVLALYGLLSVPFYTRQWLSFISWPFLYFLAYTLLGVSSYFWYYAPLLPGYVVLIGLGLSAIVRAASLLWGKPEGKALRLQRVSLGLSAALLIALSAAQIVPLTHEDPSFNPRFKIYRKVGVWLQNNTPVEASAGTLEVGIIGYYSNRRIVDFAGLIQPDVAATLQKETTFDQSALFAVEKYRPDYLILHENHFPELEEHYVSRYCQAEKRFESEDFGYGTDLVIYACQSP